MASLRPGHFPPTGWRLALLALMLPVAASAAAQESKVEALEAEAAGPHHLSVILGGTRVPEHQETGFTIGLDYEYRVSRTVGLGVVVEHAFGEIDATTLLGVADIHLVRGLVVQTGPGVEFVQDESFFVYRLGLLYEFELGEGFTLSPQLHYDFSGAENGIVFGVAFGRAF
jgi:hypothetical protein